MVLVAQKCSPFSSADFLIIPSTWFAFLTATEHTELMFLGNLLYLLYMLNFGMLLALQHCQYYCLVAQKCLVRIFTACPQPSYPQRQYVITNCLTACPLLRPPRIWWEHWAQWRLLQSFTADPPPFSGLNVLPPFTQPLIHSIVLLLTLGLLCFLNSRHQKSFGNPNMYSKFILI